MSHSVLQADMDAAVLSACGLLIGLGVILHVWGRLKSPRPTYDHTLKAIKVKPMPKDVWL